MDKMSIYEALAGVQAELKAPKNQLNKFGGYKYRSCEDILEAVKPLLLKHALVLQLSDEPQMVGEWHYIKATAMVTDFSGQQVSCTAYARESREKKGMDDSQITGTASSYARKYALNGLFCIDDTKDADANKDAPNASRKPGGGKAPQKQTPVCACCGKSVGPVKRKDGTIAKKAEEVAEYTQKTYGRVLCWTCAKKQPEDGGLTHA